MNTVTHRNTSRVICNEYSELRKELGGLRAVRDVAAAIAGDPVLLVPVLLSVAMMVGAAVLVLIYLQ